MKLSTQTSSNNYNSKENIIKNISCSLKTLGIYLESYSTINEKNNIISAMGSAVDELTSALINEGCNEEYVMSYKQWGEYGWSFNASMRKTFFLTVPNSLQEADTIMDKYCGIDEVSKIVSELKSYGVNQKDLDEAYFLHANQKYKSSVMMLFSLIDCQLINKNFFKKNGRLKTGCSVVKELQQDEEKFVNSIFVNYLQYILIISCLLELFADGNDFVNEPAVINRNFLIHGMSEKDVNEIDCMKVWYALYSLTVIYPELENEIQ